MESSRSQWQLKARLRNRRRPLMGASGMKWPTSSLRKRRPRPRKNKPSAKGFRGRWSAEIQPLEDRALLSAGQDLVNQLKPYQTALTTAIHAATSLPLIGNQFKSV